MSSYYERLYKAANQGFFRSFRTNCSTCGKALWSVKEEFIDQQKTIYAYFMCPNCGKKWKTPVFGASIKGYKFRQALAQDCTIKGIKMKCLRLSNKEYIIYPDKVKVRSDD